MQRVKMYLYFTGVLAMSAAVFVYIEAQNYLDKMNDWASS